LRRFRDVCGKSGYPSIATGYQTLKNRTSWKTIASSLWGDFWLASLSRGSNDHREFLNVRAQERGWSGLYDFILLFVCQARHGCHFFGLFDGGLDFWRE